MFLKSVDIVNFRNYSDLSLELVGGNRYLEKEEIFKNWNNLQIFGFFRVYL